MHGPTNPEQALKFAFFKTSSYPCHDSCPSYFPHLLFFLLLILLLRIESFFPPLSTFSLPLLLLIFLPPPFDSPCVSSSPVYLFPFSCIFLNSCSSAFKLIVFSLSSHTFILVLHRHICFSRPLLCFSFSNYVSSTLTILLKIQTNLKYCNH